MKYGEQLLDPRWQRKRLEVLNRAGFKCEECGDITTTLHVHHRYYVSHRMAWEYPDFCFQCLCKNCHEDIKLAADHLRSFDSASNMFSEWEFVLDYFKNDIIKQLPQPIFKDKK